MLSYEATIIRELNKFGSGVTANPDAKSNVGSILGEYYLWRIIAKFATAKVETLYKKMEDDNLVKAPDAPGTYEVLSSEHFVLSMNVSQPYKRFSGDELAKLLKNGKYKVPEPYTKEKLDEARIAGNSVVRKDIKEVV
jgi:hypothetical protein